MPEQPQTAVVGRGALHAPPNRFETIHVATDYEQLVDGDELLEPERRVPTQFLVDDSRSLLTSNDSPDVPFRYSVNPYRGCEHGCAYYSIHPHHDVLESTRKWSM